MRNLFKTRVTTYLSSPKKRTVLIDCPKLITLVSSFSIICIPIWRINYMIPLPEIYVLPQMNSINFILKPGKIKGECNN